MKAIFIEALYRKIITLPTDLVEALPGAVALFTSVQFTNSQQKMKGQIEAEGKKVVLPTAPHSKYPGQLLGCGIKKFNEKFDAFLYVGDGVFHPQTLVVENNKPVFIFDPFGDNKKWEMLDTKIVADKLKRKK